MISNPNEVLYDNETLKTPRLLLRKFEKRDTGDVLAFGSDPDTLEHLIWQGVKTLDEARAAIVDYYWSKPGIYAIEHRGDGRCIGCIDLRLIPEHDKASFGYVLSRDYWGRGYMTEALAAVLQLCFDTLLLNRVEAEHYVGNEASGRVMEKCGMRREGTGLQEVNIRGVFRDVAHYGLLRSDWLKQMAI